METQIKPSKMKTIYLRKKRSGNFEVCSRDNHTHKSNTKKGLKQIWDNMYSGKLIKATYSLSQTYFNSFDEFYKSLI